MTANHVVLWTGLGIVLLACYLVRFALGFKSTLRRNAIVFALICASFTATEVAFGRWSLALIASLAIFGIGAALAGWDRYMRSRIDAVMHRPKETATNTQAKSDVPTSRRHRDKLSGKDRRRRKRPVAQ